MTPCKGQKTQKFLPQILCELRRKDKQRHQTRRKEQEEKQLMSIHGLIVNGAVVWRLLWGKDVLWTGRMCREGELILHKEQEMLEECAPHVAVL